MADNKNLLIAVIAVVAIVVIGVGVYFAFFNNGGGSSDDDNGDPYYFYVNFGDKDVKTKWYSATGTNTDEALASAMKDAGIELSYSSYGYPNFNGGQWGTFSYNWSICSSQAATDSIGSPFYDTWGGFVKSNGWDNYSGYGSAAKKMDQGISQVFIFSAYDESYNIVDPSEDTAWMTAAGENPFVKNVTMSHEATYYFYINLGDGDANSKWYSAKSTNADDALAAAIKDSGIELSYSSYGYPNFNGKAGGMYAYNWSDVTKEAADSSTSTPVYGDFNYFQRSNGWDGFSGFGTAAKKVYQSNAEIFIFCQYDESYNIDDPTEFDTWKTAGGSNPFKA